MALTFSKNMWSTVLGFSSLRAASPLRLQGFLRTLYSGESLGVDAYEKSRNKTLTQFAGVEERFKEKMKEFATGDSKNMIFTEDLKNIVHLIEDKPEDFALVHQMMKKFNQQNKHLRFGNFVFGPVVMRMYHFLNEPALAFEVFTDAELDGMFDQLSSYQILSDLLYRNEMYDKVLQVLEIAKTKQLQGFRFPRNVAVLAFASCYKLNTTESYEYAISTLNEMKEIGTETNRRMITYAAALALQQNAPSVALEMLSMVQKANYHTVRNLKITALADLNRPDDAFPIVRYSIESDDPTITRKASICSDVLVKLGAAVERAGNKEITLEFEKLHKACNEVGIISEEPLAKALDANIDFVPHQQNNQNQGFQRDGVNKSFRPGQQMNLRPRRNPVYARERQSIKHEY